MPHPGHVDIQSALQCSIIHADSFHPSQTISAHLQISDSGVTELITQHAPGFSLPPRTEPTHQAVHKLTGRPCCQGAATRVQAPPKKGDPYGSPFFSLKRHPRHSQVKLILRSRSMEWLTRFASARVMMSCLQRCTRCWSMLCILYCWWPFSICFSISSRRPSRMQA